MTTNNSNQNQSQTPGQTQRPQFSANSGPSRHWRWFIIAILAIVIIVMIKDNFSPQHDPDSPAIVWNYDYQEALKKAKDQNKPQPSHKFVNPAL